MSRPWNSPMPRSRSRLSIPTVAAGFEAMLDRGYTPLFNGKDLTEWRNPYPFGQAKVVDGEIHLLADKKFFLVTEKSITTFESVSKFSSPRVREFGRDVPLSRRSDSEKLVYGYQAECDGSDRRWSGGLYDEARRGWIWPSTPGRSEDQFLMHEEKSKAAFGSPRIRDALNRNGWNQFVITCIEDRISIELNGVQTVNVP